MAGCGQILLVEDAFDTARLYSLLLNLRTYQVTTVGTLKAATTLCSATHFDLLICDLCLPDGDGYSLLKVARESSPGIRAILVTRNAGAWSEAAALASGFSACLVRPTTKDRLNSLVERVLSEPDEPLLHFSG